MDQLISLRFRVLRLHLLVHIIVLLCTMQTRHDKYTAYSIYQTISVEVQGNKIPDIILDSIIFQAVTYFPESETELVWAEDSEQSNNADPGLAWPDGALVCRGGWPVDKQYNNKKVIWLLLLARHLSLNIFMVTVPSDPVTAALQPGLANFDIIAQHKYSQGAEKLLCLSAKPPLRS